MIGRRAAIVLFAQIFILPTLAQAEDQKPAAGEAQVNSPQQVNSAQPDSKTFGDWVLRCQPATQGAAGKICEVTETIRSGPQQAPMAEIALSRFNPTDPIRLTAHVPSNISLPSVVKFSYREAHGIELHWRRCAPIGCFADNALTDEQSAIFRVQTEPGTFEFYDADGHSLKLPVSFKGLGQALDALSKP